MNDDIENIDAPGALGGDTAFWKAAASQAEAELARYRFLFDNIDEGFCIIEFLDGPHGPLSDYVHVQANAAYARHTGIANVVGQKVREMVPDEAGGWVELYRNVLLTGEPIRFERELVATRRYLELSSFRLEPASRRQVAVLFQDITLRRAVERSLQQLNENLEARVATAIENRRRAEQALRQSQKMEAIGLLTGGIAHDFNNMLAVIASSLRLAERRLKSGAGGVQEFIDSAKDGVDRASTLVSRLMSFSRQQPLAPERVDVNDLLRNMEIVLRRSLPESIDIEFVRAGGLWHIHADAHGLETALLNLTVNARDAMAGIGKLTIETANCHLDDAYVADQPDLKAGQFVLVAVSDTGGGMTPDTIARAFEPFFTTKEVGAGTGLGLSQVYGFVKQSGGHAKIYSELGVGTTVKLYFPRVFEPGSAVRAAPAIADAPLATGAGQLVLIVEDDADVRRLTINLVRELGFRVVAAENALAALEILESHADVELMITDVVMPGMNGRELAEKVLAERPGMRVLFTTGYPRNAVVHNGTLSGKAELLIKPYTLEMLAVKLKRLLG